MSVPLCRSWGCFSKYQGFGQQNRLPESCVVAGQGRAGILCAPSESLWVLRERCERAVLLYPVVSPSFRVPPSLQLFVSCCCVL